MLPRRFRKASTVLSHCFQWASTPPAPTLYPSGALSRLSLGLPSSFLPLRFPLRRGGRHRFCAVRPEAPYSCPDLQVEVQGLHADIQQRGLFIAVLGGLQRLRCGVGEKVGRPGMGSLLGEVSSLSGARPLPLPRLSALDGWRGHPWCRNLDPFLYEQVRPRVDVCVARMARKS